MEDITPIVARAAAVIRQCGPSALRQKPDGSPVTAADEAAEAVILRSLERLAPDIPIISEERAATGPAPSAGSTGEPYFLVDPLDGTREFIAGRDEFAVNIALINRGTPLMGIIAAPAADLVWRGIVGGGGAERVPASRCERLIMITGCAGRGRVRIAVLRLWSLSTIRISPVCRRHRP